MSTGISYVVSSAATRHRARVHRDDLAAKAGLAIDRGCGAELDCATDRPLRSGAAAGAGARAPAKTRRSSSHSRYGSSTRVTRSHRAKSTPVRMIDVDAEPARREQLDGQHLDAGHGALDGRRDRLRQLPLALECLDSRHCFVSSDETVSSDEKWAPSAPTSPKTGEMWWCKPSRRLSRSRPEMARCRRGRASQPSSTMVTGPSLTSSTAILAPNRPVSTAHSARPRAARRTRR